MNKKIKINDIYEQNINFLIGSGASLGLFPTLALEIKDDHGEKQTVETLATKFKKEDDESSYALLFMHYYKTCIEPAMLFEAKSIKKEPDKIAVLKNYKRFCDTLLTILQKKNNGEKKCNIFTTNYDGCFPVVADNLIKKGNFDFILNDGARGFTKRYLQAKNFNSTVSQTGIFERHQTDIPQINLIHLHGSISWYKEIENIGVDYSITNNKKRKIDDKLLVKSEKFSEVLIDKTKTIKDLPKIVLKKTEMDEFWESYDQLPIVNPTKWKFQETVFEEHYYQMLRLLSYELEKPNSIFITFGFSFADEHILNLVKRSLSNPKLLLYICCFKRNQKLEEQFKQNRNVKFITIDGELDFSAFNKEVFSITEPETKRSKKPKKTSKANNEAKKKITPCIEAKPK